MKFLNGMVCGMDDALENIPFGDVVDSRKFLTFYREAHLMADKIYKRRYMLIRMSKKRETFPEAMLYATFH